MKYAIIVHGFKGKPHTNWKPWLRDKLEEAGFTVYVPEMPNTDTPDVGEWVSTLAGIINITGEDEVYFIGHSLGCISILKYLETLSDGQKVKACIFVAGFAGKFTKYQGGHDSFFETDLDWQKLKNKSDTFIAIHSEDDSSVDFEEASIFKDNLGAKIISVTGKGHFGSSEGVFEVPIVLDAILDIK